MKRPDWTKAHTGPTIGMALAFLAVMLTVAADGLKIGPPAFFDTVRAWQDLLGGALGVLAAVFAGTLVLSQIKQVDGLEAARAARAETSARAVLPLGLSALTVHARAAGAVALGFVGPARPRKPKTGLPPFPPPPSGVIPDLQAFILAGPTDIGGEIAQAIADLQVLHTQAGDVWAVLAAPGRVSGVTRDNLVELVARAAAIHARAATLFDYARRESEGFAPLRSIDVENALTLMGAYPDVYPDIAQRAFRLTLG